MRNKFQYSKRTKHNKENKANISKYFIYTVAILRSRRKFFEIFSYFLTKCLIKVCGKSPDWIETPPTHNPPCWFLVYYCTKNQVRGLCVGGHRVSLFLVRSMVKWSYLRLRTTHTLAFWYRCRYCQRIFNIPKIRWVGCA